MSELLLKVEEGARRLGLGRAKVYELIQRGEIRTVRVGKARRIPVHALEEFVQGLEAEQSASAGGQWPR